MSKTKQPRTFRATKRNGETVTVETMLTDAEILEALGGEEYAKKANDFKAKCAFEVYKAINGFRANDKFFAWGAIMAMEGNKRTSAAKTLQLPEVMLTMVVERRPLRVNVPSGGVVKISKSGPGSKNHGGYVLNNDVAFRAPGAKFYGYATSAGVWTPTRDVSTEIEEVILRIGK